MEQKHQQKDGQLFIDYEMFIHTSMAPDEVVILNVTKTTEEEAIKALSETQESKNEPKTSLTISGVSGNGDVLFQYTNKD
jgi:hypothetical protein